MGVGVAVGALGLLAFRSASGTSRVERLNLLDKLRTNASLTPKESALVSACKSRFPSLSDTEAVALESEATLSDAMEKMIQYSKFDSDLVEEIQRVAAGAAEFLLMAPDQEKKKSIPPAFRAFTVTLMRRVKELRRIIRDTAPSLLEEFDEIRTELDEFATSSHHNMWCDATL